jgi:hypothetical protein
VNLQRRIAEARRASLVRSVGRRSGFAWWFRRARIEPDHDASALKPQTEDFGHAIRF